MTNLSDSVRAFRHASEHIGGIVSAISLSGQHSVWLATDLNDARFVLKYFESSNFDDHLFLEEMFLTENSKSSLVPQMVMADYSNRLLVLEWIENHPFAIESIGKILSDMRDVLSRLKVPAKVHEGLPSGIQSWPKPLEDAGIGEVMVTNFLMSQQEISASWQRTKENWFEVGLVHGDIRLANILRTSSGIAIIDWESYLLGPPEWDDACLFASVILESMLDGPLSLWAINSLPEISKLSEGFSQQLRDHLIVKLSQSAIDMAAAGDDVPMQSAWLIDLALGLASKGRLDFVHIS